MHYLNKALPALALTFTLGLSGCGGMMAQNPGESFSPVNVFASPSGQKALLGGADMVAYFTEGQFKQGEPKYESTHEGVTFLFSSASNKALFDDSPEKFLPQYGGYCANGIMFGIPWGGNATDYLMHNGKLYLFGGSTSQAAFELELDKNIALADKYWAEEISGSNSFVQRAKRLTMRVPHYKTGEEQAEEVRKAQAGK